MRVRPIWRHGEVGRSSCRVGEAGAVAVATGGTETTMSRRSTATGKQRDAAIAAGARTPLQAVQGFRTTVDRILEDGVGIDEAWSNQLGRGLAGDESEQCCPVPAMPAAR